MVSSCLVKRFLEKKGFTVDLVLAATSRQSLWSWMQKAAASEQDLSLAVAGAVWLVGAVHCHVH